MSELYYVGQLVDIKRMPTKNTLFGGGSGRFRVSDSHKAMRAAFDLDVSQRYKSRDGLPLVSTGVWWIQMLTVTRRSITTRIKPDMEHLKGSERVKSKNREKLDMPLPGIDSDACICFVRDSLERNRIVDNDARITTTIGHSMICEANAIYWVLSPRFIALELSKRIGTRVEGLRGFVELELDRQSS